MKYTSNICLTAIVIALTGCAAPAPPTFVTVPVPPLEWKVLLEKKVGCPDATGEYESTPKVAVLQNDSEWSFSNGMWYYYLSIFPFNRVHAEKTIRRENSLAYSPDSLVIESNKEGVTLRVVSPDKDNENFRIHVFSKAENDYRCLAGNLVFPESQNQGGTEGGFINEKIYRQATITSAGDLLFYEQIQSHKSIHRYYLFKMKNRQDSQG